MALCFCLPLVFAPLGVWAVTEGWGAVSVSWSTHSFSNWGEEPSCNLRQLHSPNGELGRPGSERLPSSGPLA